MPLTIEELREIEKAGKPLAKAIAKAAAEHPGNETAFRRQFANLIDDLAEQQGITLSLREEYTLATGRADAAYNRFIVEYEPPGSLRKSKSNRATAHAVQQVKDYIEGVTKEERQKIHRLAGVATDGHFYVFVRHVDEQWAIDDPVEVNEHSTAYLLRLLFSLTSGRALIPRNLIDDFGSRNLVAQQCARALYNSLEGNPPKLVGKIFEQWQTFFGEVTGYEEGSARFRNKKELQAFAKGMGLDPKKIDPPKLFFSVHTYFAILIKFIAWLALSRFVSKFGTDFAALQNLPGEELQRRLREMERGGIFRRLGINNFLEGDFFGWYLITWSQHVEDSVRVLLRRLSDYDPGTLEVSPEQARDLLKKLYHYLMPRELRHDLGEYYTPDWLAQRLLNQLEGGKFRGDPKKRLIDPACGSGTFLVLAIHAMKERCRQLGYNEATTLDLIRRNIVGIDLNPLAVIASRTNYVLALGDLLEHRTGEIDIPVYLADSIVMPSRGQDLFGHRSYSIRTAVGTFEVPGCIDTQPEIETLANLLDECVESGTSVEAFLQRARSALSSTVSEAQWTESKDLFATLYQRLLDLHKEGLNGLWARIIKNAFMPLYLGQFDYVAGNPPWVNWENLPLEESSTSDSATGWPREETIMKFTRSPLCSRLCARRIEGKGGCRDESRSRATAATGAPSGAQLMSLTPRIAVSTHNGVVRALAKHAACTVLAALVGYNAMASVVEHLGQPCRAKCILAGRVVTRRATGRECFVLTDMNEATGMELIFIDLERDAAESFRAPAGSGAWALLEVPGDRLIVGTYYDGQFMVFDLKAMKFIKAVGFPGEQYIWKLALGSDGRVYGGTFPGAKLGALDLNTYTVEDLGAPVLPNLYSRWVSATPEGRILCIFGNNTPATLLFDPATKKFEKLPPKLEGVSMGVSWNGYFISGSRAFKGGSLEVVDPPPFPVPPPEKGDWSVLLDLTTDDVLFLGQGSAVYRYAKGDSALTLVGDFDLRGGWLLASAANGSVLGARGQQYFIIKPGAKELMLRPIPVESGPRPTLFLRADDRGRLWGGPEGGQTLFWMDTRTGKVVNTDAITNAAGDVYDVTFIDGKVYAASYCGGDITVYDPEQPWDQWNGKNPRHLAAVPGYIRPTGGIVTGPDGKLYSGWMARYGVYGGAVAITEPVTGATEVIENPLGEQAINGLAVDDRFAYIGTTLGANGLNRKPNESARFGVLDLATRKVVFQHTFNKATRVRRVVYDPRTRRVAMAVGTVDKLQLRVFDVASQRFVHNLRPGAPPVSPAAGVTSGSAVAPGDGKVYYGSGRSLVAVDLQSGEVTHIADAPKGISSITIAPDGTIYFSCNEDVYRVKM
jgi:hypothetical protein